MSKREPLWQAWRNNATGYGAKRYADELESAARRVRERVMALPTHKVEEYSGHNLVAESMTINRDAVLNILREEGLIE